MILWCGTLVSMSMRVFRLIVAKALFALRALCDFTSMDDDISYSMTLVVPICIVTLRVIKQLDIHHTLLIDVMVMEIL